MTNDLGDTVQEPLKKENLRQTIYVYLQQYCQPPGETPIARPEVTLDGITQAIYGKVTDGDKGSTVRVLNKLVDSGIVKRRKTGVSGRKAVVFIYWLVQNNEELLEAPRGIKKHGLPIIQARTLADKLLDLGYSLELKGQYRNAMSVYKTAMELFPEFTVEEDIAKVYRNALEKILRK